MAQYKVWTTGKIIEIDEKKFQFPSSGEKTLLKTRIEIATKVSTD